MESMEFKHWWTQLSDQWLQWKIDCESVLIKAIDANEAIGWTKCQAFAAIEGLNDWMIKILFIL